MSRLDRLKEILDGYEVRKSPDEPKPRFLLVVDRNYETESGHRKVTVVGYNALKESTGYTPNQAVLVYRGNHAYFSGWHDFNKGGNEEEMLMDALKLYREERPSDTDWHDWLDASARKAVEHENTRILYLLPENYIVPKDFYQGVQEWQDNEKNQGRMSRISPKIASDFPENLIDIIRELFEGD